MKRLLSMIVLSSLTALATWGARRMMSGGAAGTARRRSTPKPALETWEGEGGNLHPREARSLQQQLG
jgi:hypothetical protein